MDTGNSNYVRIRGITLAIWAMLVTACGGGNDGNDGIPNPPAVSALPEGLSISWSGDLTQPQSRITTLSVSVPMTKSGIKQVDFFVDGVMAGTSTAGANQPGAPILVFLFPWNTAAYSDGPHTVMARVTDNANLTAESTTQIVTLKNNIALPVALSPRELFPTPSSAAAGSGQLSVNLATGAMAGGITLTNMTASAVHLHSGWPTTSGESILALSFDPIANTWIVPEGSALTSFGSASQVNELLAGGLYVDAHSASHPDGEVRAQVLFNTMSLAFGTLTGDQEVPPVSSQGSGIVSILENRSTLRFQINARTIGLDDVVSIGVYSVSGPAIQSNWLGFLRPDANGNRVWSDNMRAPGYNSGAWYVNVTTARYLSGEIGGLLPVVDASGAGDWDY